MSVRVDMVCTFDYLGGAARAAYRVHRALLASDVPSTLLVQCKVTSDPTVFSESPTAYRIRSALDVLPLTLGRTPREPYRSLAWVGVDLRRRLDIHPCDVVHLHWINGGFVRPEALPGLGRPLVWTLHDEWAFEGARHYAGNEAPLAVDRWVTRRKRRAYRRIPSLTLVAPSRWMAERARRSELLAGRRIEVIPYCIDTTLYLPQEKAAARAAWGLPPAGPIALFVGDVGDPRKGFAYLWKAAAGIPGLRVAVAGPLSPAGTIALGAIRDEARLILAYNAADLVVCPSLEDNLPNVVLEAFACGTPCVAARTGGLPEMVEEGVNGAVANPRDAGDLRRALEVALAQAVTLGAAARARAVERWSYAAVAAQHLAMYRSLL